MTSDRLDELIALAALGELSEDEERELDLLLAAAPDASAELRSALEAAAAVQATVAEAPPPGLRDRVMAATAGMPQLAAELDEGRGAADGAEGAVTGRSPVTNVVTLDSRRRRVASFVAAVAAAAVLVVGGAVIVTNDRDGDDPIAEVVAAPDVTEDVLTGELGELRLYYSPSEGAIVIDGRVTRFPEGDNTLELWLVDETGATPVGLFRPDADGRVAERFDGVDPTGFLVGVTEEPPGGSDVPTLPILAST